LRAWDGLLGLALAGAVLLQVSCGDEVLVEGGALLGAATCPDCEIVIQDRLRLGDDFSFGVMPQVALTRSGYIVGLDEFVPTGGGPLLFDTQGRVFGVLGGRGQGPGEFRFPARLAGGLPSDTLLIFDRASGLQVVDIHGTHLRTFTRVPTPRGSAIRLNDTILVVASMSRRPVTVPDQEVAAFDLRSGEPIGGLGPLTGMGPGALSIPWAALAGDDRVWLPLVEPNRVGRFRIGATEPEEELTWDPYGLATVHPRYRTVRADTGGVAIKDLWEQPDENLLWVLSGARDPSVASPWERLVPGQPFPEELRTVEGLLGTGAYSIVSVLDMESRTVLAHLELDRGAGLGFLPDGRLAVMGVAEGTPHATAVYLFRLRLRGWEGR
jgi:hypothetical protein